MVSFRRRGLISWVGRSAVTVADWGALLALTGEQSD